MSSNIKVIENYLRMLVEECKKVKSVGMYMVKVLGYEAYSKIDGADKLFINAVSDDAVRKLVEDAYTEYVKRNEEYERYFYFQILPLFFNEKEIDELQQLLIETGKIEDEEKRDAVRLEWLKKKGEEVIHVDGTPYMRAMFVAMKCVEEPWNIAYYIIINALRRMMR